MGLNYNTDQKKRQERIDKDAEHVRARDIADIQKLLRLPEFRRFVWSLWTKTGIFRDPFSPNALTMSRECGQQGVGKDLLADVNDADVNAFGQIQREFISEQKSKKALEEKEKEKENGNG